MAPQYISATHTGSTVDILARRRGSCSVGVRGRGPGLPGERVPPQGSVEALCFRGQPWLASVLEGGLGM